MTVHPPKREVFDIGNQTNTDPKGIVRDVDVYDVRPWGCTWPARHRVERNSTTSSRG